MARKTDGTLRSIVGQDKETLQELIRRTVQEFLEAEMAEGPVAARGERPGKPESPGPSERHAGNSPLDGRSPESAMRVIYQ